MKGMKDPVCAEADNKEQGKEEEEAPASAETIGTEEDAVERRGFSLWWERVDGGKRSEIGGRSEVLVHEGPQRVRWRW